MPVVVVDDGRVEQVAAEPVPEPSQVGGVTVVDGRSEFDLEGDDPVVGPLDDQIDLVVPTPRPQVVHGSFGGLRVHTQAQRHE